MKENVMKSRISLRLIMMLAALMISFIPAASITTQKASALSTCDWAQFIADVTVPDGTPVSPGANFVKTWRLKNIGSCTWTTAYSLVFDTGTQMGGPSSVNLPSNVAPGQTVDISITLTAPSTAGQYIGYWKFKNASGVLFGIGSTTNRSWWVQINVSGGSTGVAYDFAANYCSASWYSAQGNLPCPGTDGDSRGFVLNVAKPQLEDGTFDAGNGLITMPQNGFNGDIHGVYPAFHVQSGDKFQSKVNCAYGSYSCYVTFRLDYMIGNGPINTYWTWREKYEGLYYRTNIDLSPLAGQDVKFILTILANGSPAGDRALWSNPVIARAGTTSPPPPPPAGFSFDFGTASSPLASGYLRVTETTVYTTGGYGWTNTSGLESRDRTSLADPLKRDFVMSSSVPKTFKVDLPNGSYSVNVTMGDNDFAHDNMIVKANGTTVLGDVDTATGAFAVNSFNVSVTGGSLSFDFSDGGGADPTWVVNALTITPGSTPPPTSCDRAQFVTDVTIPDGSIINPGSVFSKTWRLKNVGSCTWTTSYMLLFDTGAKMGGPDSVNLPNTVAPGQTVDLTINLTAPTTGGSYRGYWKFKNANGIPFGIGVGGTKSWWVDIRVPGATSNTPIPTPGTPVPTTTPVAGTMYDFAANACSAVWFSSAGTLPCPGRDGDQKGFILKLSNPQLENGTVDSRMGLLTYPQNIFNGYIQGIYPSYRVKAGDRFRSIVNCAYGATSCYVVFRLDYQTGTSPITTFWAFVEKYDSQYYQADLDLSSLVGQDIKFILTVLSTGSPTGDRALWVAPIIYNPSSVTTTPVLPSATPTLTPAVTPTATTAASTQAPTATATGTGTSTSNWNTYQDVKFGFSFQFPPGSSVSGQTDNSGRVTLPITSGTNLFEKYIDISVVEDAPTCQSSHAVPGSPSTTVTINGTPFLQQTGSEGAAGSIYDWVGYSTFKGTDCVSLNFILHSNNPGVFPTPPPVFDKTAESAVFNTIMSTFVNQ
jgi:hypothetical protein